MSGRIWWRNGVQRNSGTWMAFLAMTFVVVGLTGLFASYAAPLPLERALARDAALDEALASGGQHDLLDKLRLQLDDSAATVIDGTGPLEARVASARASMRAELLHEADSVGSRLRMMIVVVTLLAAVFGAVIVGAASRSR
jgi:hypothetical protein